MLFFKDLLNKYRQQNLSQYKQYSHCLCYQEKQFYNNLIKQNAQNLEFEKDKSRFHIFTK